MEIEIYSDVVCPWCYLGHVRLTAALDDPQVSTAVGDVILRWRAYQLDPNGPTPGRPLLDWLAPRFGGIDRARSEMARVQALARQSGLDLRFDRALIANTFDAHRLLWFADQPQAVRFGAFADTQPRLAEALHRAHFVDGADVSSHSVLIEVANEVDLDPDRVRNLLSGTEGSAEVRGQVALAHELGIHSVPTIIIDGRYVVSGALDGGQLRQALLAAAAAPGSPAPPVTFVTPVTPGESAPAEPAPTPPATTFVPLRSGSDDPA